MERPNVSPFFFLTFSLSHLHMHDVTPSVVPSAVRIEIRICTIIFHVSFFILLTSYILLGPKPDTS